MFSRTRTGLHALVKLGGVVVALIVLGSCLVFAQGSAVISGMVRDATGAVLPGVTVTIKHTESGLTRTVDSTENGSYRMPSLPVGPYEVTGEKAGFKQGVRRGINLAVAQEAVVDLTLDVGSVGEQVTVTEEAPLVNTTLSSTSGLITEQQVKDLPLNGRSFDQLLTLNVSISNNTSNIGQGNGWTGFSVAGKREETNRFLINGIDWVGGNSPGQFITPPGGSGELLGGETVRGYKVLQHTHGGRYGETAGGANSGWA